MESLLYAAGTSSVQGRNVGGTKSRERLTGAEVAIANFVLEGEGVCVGTGRMATGSSTNWCAVCGEPAEVKRDGGESKNMVPKRAKMSNSKRWVTNPTDLHQSLCDHSVTAWSVAVEIEAANQGE